MLVKNTRTPQKKFVPLDCSLTLPLDASFLKEVVAKPYIYLIIWQADIERWLLKHDIVKITYNMITYILLLNTLRSSLFEASSRINCLFSISSSPSSFIFLQNILARSDTTRYITWPSGWPQFEGPTRVSDTLTLLFSPHQHSPLKRDLIWICERLISLTVFSNKPAAIKCSLSLSSKYTL